MIKNLPFWHAPLPYRDFVVFACKDYFENQLMPENFAVSLAQLNFTQTLKASYENIRVYFAENKNAVVTENFIFSGYLQHNGLMYMGQDELPKNLQRHEIIGAADGYFTFACTDENTTIVSQDWLGQDIIFYYMCGNYMVASNRYHLLLLFLAKLGYRGELNYDKVLMLMCCEALHRQNATRDMFFAGLKSMLMTENIMIDKNGWRVEEKRATARLLEPITSKKESATLFEQGIEEIKENARAAFSYPFREGITIDITGGYDSRISLAAMLNTGRRDFSARTVVEEAVPGDKEISALITEKFNIAYRDSLFYPRELWPSFDDFLAWKRSTGMGLQYQLRDLDISRPASDCSILRISGAYGEHYKNYYMKWVPDLLEKETTVDEIASAYVFIYSSPFSGNNAVTKRLARLLRDEMALLPGETAQEKFNLFWTFYNARIHFGLHQGRTPAWAPHMAKSTWRYANSIPYYERAKRHRSFINMEIARTLCPELEEIPYSNGQPMPRYLCGGKDVTHECQSIDFSVLQEASREFSKAWKEWCAAQENIDEYRLAWSERASVASFKRESLSLFDRLAEYSPQLAAILNPQLRVFLERTGNSKIISIYYLKLLTLADQIDIFGNPPSNTREYDENSYVADGFVTMFSLGNLINKHEVSIQTYLIKNDEVFQFVVNCDYKEDDLHFAYYIFVNDKIIERTDYISNKTYSVEFPIQYSGYCYATVFVKKKTEPKKEHYQIFSKRTNIK